MSTLKTFLVVALTGLTLSAFAADNKTGGEPAPKAERFNDFKQHMLERADREISMLQQFKSCLSAAKDKTAADVCKKNKMDTMQEFHKDNQESKQDMHQNMQERREERREEKKAGAN